MKSTLTEESTNPTTEEIGAGPTPPALQFTSEFVESRLKSHREWQKAELKKLMNLVYFARGKHENSTSRYKRKNVSLSAESTK